MSVTTNPTAASLLPIDEIERMFRSLDAGAFFVLPRVLRRVLRSELELSSPWVRIPHRKSYVIDREKLVWLVARDELGADVQGELPSRIILLARPEDGQLERFNQESLTRYYWRLLFHARLDLVLQESTSPARMSPARLRERINRIGQVQFDEIRSVLKREAMLVAPLDSRNVLAEFIAVLFELRAFDPELVSLYFPALTDVEALAQELTAECQPEHWLHATQPPGMQAAEITVDPEPEVAPLVSAASPVEQQKSDWRYKRLVRSATWYRQRGNHVRAALTRQQALLRAPLDYVSQTQAEIEQDLGELARRLVQACQQDAELIPKWQHVCQRLLSCAGEEFYSVPLRLLYDLQKICVDSERAIYRVDLLRYVISVGREPLQRPLPHQQLVLMAKHLQRATGRLGGLRIDRAFRTELGELLRDTAEQADARLRQTIEPTVSLVLQESGLKPHRVVERVAFHKIVAELLDGVVERGYFTLGHLRDTISRSQLKLPDLTNARELLLGDPLLRTDLRLSRELEGIYQRGPFYLRWLQRLNSVAFGTAYGRVLTQFLVLPFGGAFIILKGLQHLVHDGIEFLSGPSAKGDHKSVEIYSETSLLLLGCLLFALIHAPEVRWWLWQTLIFTGRAIHFLFWKVPAAIINFPPISRLLRSLPAMVFRRYLFSPLAITLIFWQLLPRLGTYEAGNHWMAIAIFTIACVVLNSRVGRDTEELTWEFLGKAWHQFRVNFVIALFNAAIEFFRLVMDAVERVLYAVDEWLRFRSGDTLISLGVKAVLGLVWGFVQAVIRFCVTLLIEPQVNPIKHFPVVTVSHKLILPFTGNLIYLLTPIMGPIWATTAGPAITSGIPGIFGFLAWELKENWKLYSANRSPRLKPVVVGHHGETLHRLLKPGFHSGTIPQLFGKQRRNARKSRHRPGTLRQNRFEVQLHDVAVTIDHFLQREFIALLQETRPFRQRHIEVGTISLSTNQILVQIECDGSAAPLELGFAEQSGWLIAGVTQPGWVNELPDEHRRIVATGLTGLYKLAAVDLVREQLETTLGPQAGTYDIAETGVVIWPNGSFEQEIHYSLDEHPVSIPRPRLLARGAGLSPQPLDRLLFALSPLGWERWAQYWDALGASAVESPAGDGTAAEVTLMANTLRTGVPTTMLAQPSGDLVADALDTVSVLPVS